jgi:hypothetical protein
MAATPRERWKPAPGYERDYQVSSLGRVRSLLARSRKGPEDAQGHVLAPVPIGGGYLRVCLRGDIVLVGRLVAKAFVAPYDGEVVMYKNGDKADCRAANLKWSTKSEVTAERWRRWRKAR